MGTVISNLKAKFGVDSSDFKKGLKDGDRAVDDFKGSAGGKLNEFASMFGINMGAVNGSVNTATKSLNFMGQSIKATAVSSNILSVALKVLKFALIATGIGAILVALGSLITYFKDTGKGADKFAVILAKIRSVFDNIIDRIQNFGSGLADIFSGNFREGFNKMKTAFSGIGKEIKEDWKAAGELAEAMNKVKDREVELITTLEERRQKVQELRLESKEIIDDEKKKLSLLQQAEALIKGVYGDQVGLEKERLRIMKKQLEISASDPTREQRREIADQEAKINTLLRSQAMELREISREKLRALKVVNAEIELEKKKAETISITNTAISNLKLPDFNQVISNALAPMPQFQKQIKQTMVDITSSINGAFESMAAGLGEFLGALAIGDAGIKDFGKMMAAAFADLAITVGKIVISAALAVAGIDQALKIPGAWPVALAAGVALVAVGSMVRGALANAASGGGSTSVATNINTYTYDTRAATATQKMEIKIGGTFKIQGRDLVSVIDEENTRKGIST